MLSLPKILNPYLMKKEFVFFVIALILFFFVLVDIYWWIEICSDNSTSFEQHKREYNEIFPKFLRTRYGVTLLNITILALSALLFYKSSSINKLKILSRIFLIFCLIILY